MDSNKQIRIFIICRDRLECLKQLIGRLDQMGYKTLHIVDNASTYQPLLDYYKTLPYPIHRNSENMGHLVMLNSIIADPYVGNEFYAYTDCDVIPAPECPDDFMARFKELLLRHPEYNKVGFGLKTDDLPDHYANKRDVIGWEKQYWNIQIEPGVFIAPIDTTFALVRQGKKVGWSTALRTGPPYVAQHTTWYSDLSNLPDDEEYYIAHANHGISTWTNGWIPKSGYTRVSLLHPSRWRANMAHDVYLEWVNNAANPKHIQYILALDDDDETIADYKNLFTLEDMNKVGEFIWSIKPSRSLVNAVNLAAAQMSVTSELFAIVSDDVGAPKNWDQELFKMLSGVNNFSMPKYIGVNDGLQPFGTYYIYIANRAYYNRLGYVLYPEYDGFYADNDGVAAAKTLNAIIPAPHLTFEHRNYATGKTPFDRTYAKHNNGGNIERNAAIYNARSARGFDLK